MGYGRLRASSISQDGHILPTVSSNNASQATQRGPFGSLLGRLRHGNSHAVATAHSVPVNPVDGTKSGKLVLVGVAKSAALREIKGHLSGVGIVAHPGVAVALVRGVTATEADKPGVVGLGAVAVMAKSPFCAACLKHNRAILIYCQYFFQN